MREIPVDTSKAQFISTGKAAARAEYVELSDGQRRRSGNQATNDQGVPMWVVDVIYDNDEADRADVIGVKVASFDEPITPKWRPVQFTNLIAVPYVDRNSNRVALSFRADGIVSAQEGPKAA